LERKAIEIQKKVFGQGGSNEMVEESEEINTKSRNYNKIKTSRSGGE